MADHPRWARRYFTDDDLAEIAHSVVEAEAITSGQIRVHVEPHVPRRRFAWPGHPLDRAKQVFVALGMDRTRQRNGVLIYLAIKHRKLAIVGDEGIHAHVRDEYWERVRDLMITTLRDAGLRAGIVAGVREVARVLAEHFPHRPDDTDELPDDVSLGR
ncbi:MAG: hypothetical protein DMD81_04090 [Candidatus Rokuibacteriota bacterium]|nr:MAG: hypothetical protein DMD81_04090 [Candidatus Rokubacteria bacterium]